MAVSPVSWDWCVAYIIVSATDAHNMHCWGSGRFVACPILAKLQLDMQLKDCVVQDLLRQWLVCSCGGRCYRFGSHRFGHRFGMLIDFDVRLACWEVLQVQHHVQRKAQNASLFLSTAKTLSKKLWQNLHHHPHHQQASKDSQLF